jgi:DNA replication protein DnaC
MTGITTTAAADKVSQLLKSFRLPTAATEMARRLTDAGHDAALEVVAEVLQAEHEDRWERRISRLRQASKLPPGKTFDTFDLDRLPIDLSRSLRDLARTYFLNGATNVLAFGLPGTGKSHAACALGHALVQAGHSVLFVPTFKLVQDLLVAKRELELPRALGKLDKFELLILDDIGYVKQSPEEIEVLFTLLAERYERRSVLLTSNLMFSQWDQIFQNPMTTAAAIDRLVHHSVILEFNVASYRTENRTPPPASSVADNNV